MASPLPDGVVGYGVDVVPRRGLLRQGVPAWGPCEEHDELAGGAEGDAFGRVPFVITLVIALKRWRVVVIVLICGRTVGGGALAYP